MSENKLLKFRQEKNKNEVESVDTLPDLDLFDLSDLSFLMNYSLDSELKGQDRNTINARSSWVESGPVDETKSLLKNKEDSSEIFSKAMEDEVQRLINSELERQDKKAINTQNSWEGSPVVVTKSLLKNEEDSPETFSKAMENEFLGLISNGEDTDKTDNGKQENQFSIDTSSLFGEDQAKQGMLIENEDSEQVDITRSIGDQNYQSTIARKRFSGIGSQEKIQIGLEIGEQNFKYVVVEKSGKRNVVLAFGIHANTLNKNASENDIVDKLVDEVKLISNFPKARIAWNVYGE